MPVSAVPEKSSTRCKRKDTSWLAYLSCELCTLVRLPNKASASSKNNIQSLCSARSNILLRFFSVSPIYFETICDRSTRYTSLLNSLPKSPAVKVFLFREGHKTIPGSPYLFCAKGWGQLPDLMKTHPSFNIFYLFGSKGM